MSSGKGCKLTCACEEAGAGHGAWLSLLLIADIELMLFLAWGRAITQEFLLKWFFVKPPLTPTMSPSFLSLPFFWAKQFGVAVLRPLPCRRAQAALKLPLMKKGIYWTLGLSDFLKWKPHLNKMIFSWTLPLPLDIVWSQSDLPFQSQLHGSSSAPPGHCTTLIFLCLSPAPSLVPCHRPLPSAS